MASFGLHTVGRQRKLPLIVYLFLFLNPFPLISIAQLDLIQPVSNGNQELSDDFSSYGFISPATRYTAFKYQRGFMAGLQGGWHVTNRLTLGAGIYRLITEVELGETTDDSGAITPLLLNFNYQGFLLEYSIGQFKSYRLFATAMMGKGSAEFGDNTESADYRQDDFYLVEPGFKIELNPWPNIALGLGLNYRYVLGSELVGLKDPHLRDISSLVELRFEDFDYWFSQ